MAFVDSGLFQLDHSMVFRGSMPSAQAQAIRSARVTVGLTQVELARRIGVKSRAIYRWERDAATPVRRNRSALVTAIGILNPEAGKQLKAALYGEKKQEAPSAAAFAPIAPDVALDLAILSLADELDVTPRRLRAGLLRLCKQAALAGLTLDALRQSLDRALLSSQAASTAVPS
jgi:DNA-binding XRE family transcriptional regulator